MAETSIKVSLELVDKAAQKALSDFISKGDAADKSLNKLKNSGSSTFEEIAVSIGKSTGVYEIFAGNLAANLATKGLEVLAASASALFNTFIVEGVKAAKDQEIANQALNVALAQTGIYSEQTAKDFQDLAAEIQATTGVSDDSIITNAALIQSLAGLSKEGLAQATKAAVDLSAALGKDLSTTSEALAKAANGNTTAIQKMGITFQEGNSKAETFNNILKSLEDRFGGSAADKINTFGGSVGLATTAFGELQEEIGNAIVKNNVVIEVIKTAGKIIADLTGSVSGNSQAFKELVGNGIIFFINAMMGVVTVADQVTRTVTFMIRSIINGFNAMSVAVSSVLAKLGIESEKTADKMTEAFLDSSRALRDTFREDTALGKAGEMLAQLREGALKGFDALKSGAATSVAPLNSSKQAVEELTDAQKRQREETNRFVEELAKQNESIKTDYDQKLESLKAYHEQKEALDTEAESVNYENKLAREQAYSDAQLAILDKRYADEQARIASSTLDNSTKTQALLAAESKYNIDREKLITARYAKEKELRDKQKKWDEQQDQYKLAATANMFSALGQLAALGGKKNFEIVKAFNIAAAITNAYAAITKTLADGGPYPFNIANAAAIGISAFANVAQISSQQAPSFERGGIVPGTSFTGDNVTANVNSGEMILNRGQQRELFDIANGSSGGSNGQLESKIDSLLNFLAGKDDTIIVNIGGKTIVDTLRSELSAGRSFA